MKGLLLIGSVMLLIWWLERWLGRPVRLPVEAERRAGPNPEADIPPPMTVPPPHV